MTRTILAVLSVLALAGCAHKPLSGADLKGVIGFRDIADVGRMMEACREGGRAVVIGGGLLGLEAAYGLRRNGMDVTVVHLMPTRMERPVAPPVRHRDGSPCPSIPSSGSRARHLSPPRGPAVPSVRARVRPSFGPALDRDRPLVRTRSECRRLSAIERVAIARASANLACRGGGVTRTTKT